MLVSSIAKSTGRIILIIAAAIISWPVYACEEINAMGGGNIGRYVIFVPCGTGNGLPVINVAAETDKSDNENLRNFTDQMWRLNPEKSYLNIQSVKKNAIFESHYFENFSGVIEPTGEARIKIDLHSIQTGVDIRDVRMRFLLFETYKFPVAEITTNIDPKSVQRLLTEKRVIYPLKFKVDMHGIKKEFSTDVIVTRTYDNAVSVATILPLAVKASDFGLADGITKLAETVGNIPIASAASVSFNLVFEGERFNPNLEVAAKTAESAAEAKKTSAMTADACEARLQVISTTRAIYFAKESSRLDAKSEPLLNSLADILKRCPGLVVQAAGHTDSDGSKEFNQRLSEARAESVGSYLVDKGITADRIKTVGFGQSKPVVPNTSPANKAKNRRIEFSGIGQLSN